MVGVLKAQVGFQTLNPEPSSMLDVKVNGDKKTFTIPRIFLASHTDSSCIYDSFPAHGLMVYNLNPALKEGKGLYWWDANQKKWLAIINQQSVGYYKNLVQYYVSQSLVPIDMSNAPYYGEELYKKGDKASNGWSMIPDLAIDFKIDKPSNNSKVSFTGSIGWSRINPMEGIQDISVGFGIFVDDKLVDARADVILLRDYCGYYTYYVTAVIDKLPMGNHTLKFGIKKRTRSSYQENNGFVVGGDASVVYDGYNTEKCNEINNFEAHPSATLYIIQQP
ncbi:hypothetical protein EDL99_03770 [Ornithobacterium rhinotracheale]|nr:hypothetical protein [Ornithobacterium rhinotracheale]